MKEVLISIVTDALRKASACRDSIALALRFGSFLCFLYARCLCGHQDPACLGAHAQADCKRWGSKTCGSKPLGSCLGNIHFPANPTPATQVPFASFWAQSHFRFFPQPFSHEMHTIPQRWEAAAASSCILLQRSDLASIPQSMAWCQLGPQPRCSDQALVGGCAASDSDPQKHQ